MPEQSMGFLLDLVGAERGRAIVANAGFPVYAVNRRLAHGFRISRWGYETEDGDPVVITHVAVLARLSRGDQDGTLEVASSPADVAREPDSASLAVSGLESMLLDDATRAPSWHALPDSSRDQRLAELLDEIAQQVDRNERSRLEVQADGHSATFVLIRDASGAWCAAATLGASIVKITSRNVTPVNGELALDRIVEPSLYISD
jgi:hypothetical protein